MSGATAGDNSSASHEVGNGNADSDSASEYETGGEASSEGGELYCEIGLEELSFFNGSDTVELSCVESSEPRIEVGRLFTAPTSDFFTFRSNTPGDLDDENPCHPVNIAILDGECAGEQVACGSERHHVEYSRWLEVTHWVDAGETITLVFEAVDQTAPEDEMCFVQHKVQACPSAKERVLPTEFDLRVTGRAIRGSCTPEGAAQQGSIVWNVPESGVYRLRADSDADWPAPFSLVVVNGDCRGQELACAAVDDQRKGVELTLELEADQTVVLAVELNEPHRDEPVETVLQYELLPR